MTETGVEILPSPLQEALVGEVRAGEGLLWVGQPGPKVNDWKDWFALWFGIEWTALSLLFTGGAIALTIAAGMQGQDLWPWVCLALFGIPFVLIGVLILTGPARARRLLRNTVYAVTDQRAVLIEVGYRRITVRSFEPDQLNGMIRVERPGGFGDLILFESVSVDSDGDRHVTQVGFFNIPDVRRVEELVRALRAPGHREPSN